FLRGHLPDAEPDRRQGDHRLQRLHLRLTSAPARFAPALTSKREINMSSTTTTLASSPTTAPADSSTGVLTLANVLYDKRDAIAYVTINRPKVRNALNTPTWKDLRTAFEHARDDVTVRGVILTGAGDKAFVAGADIGELSHASAIVAEQSSRSGQEVLDL